MIYNEIAGTVPLEQLMRMISALLKGTLVMEIHGEIWTHDLLTSPTHYTTTFIKETVYFVAILQNNDLNRYK